MSRGTSNDSIPRTKSSISVEKTAGRSSGSVIRTATSHVRAPPAVAASSSRVSRTRNAGPIKRYASGNEWLASAQIIPGIV